MRCALRLQDLSLYSWFGAFVGARGFQTTTGIEHFLDARQLRTGPADTDSFYFDHAARVIAQERHNGPVFVFVYLATNHFPWNYRYRPDLLPDWVNPGNPFEIDEYLRRQEMSAHDLAQFKERLGREFPDEPSSWCVSATTSRSLPRIISNPRSIKPTVARRILERDPRYFTTYYAIEGINFRPMDLSSALDTLDAPYLPLVVLEGAGLPLDADLCRAEEDPRALRRHVLSLCRRRRSAAVQPAADRRRPDPGILTAPVNAMVNGRSLSGQQDCRWPPRHGCGSALDR